ncbi:hypothetical protein, partial [Zoogloea sp. LCSB751]|uniref:hypothetical protein n=1 Tax=Zoogloea sp. LCSB751 TaxID=1965277 RepID=UPI001C1FAEE1
RSGYFLRTVILCAGAQTLPVEREAGIRNKKGDIIICRLFALKCGQLLCTTTTPSWRLKEHSAQLTLPKIIYEASLQ